MSSTPNPITPAKAEAKAAAAPAHAAVKLAAAKAPAAPSGPPGKFKEKDRVHRFLAKKLAGEITKAKKQSNGWVYEVKLDGSGHLVTYLESQLRPLKRN